MDAQFSKLHTHTITSMFVMSYFMFLLNILNFYPVFISTCFGTGILLPKLYNKNIILCKCTFIFWCLWCLYFIFILIKYISLSNYIEFHNSLLIVGSFALLYNFNDTFKQWFNKIIRNQYFLYIFCSIELFLTNIIEIAFVLNLETQMIGGNLNDNTMPNNDISMPNWRIYTDNDVILPNNNNFNNIINHSEFSKFVSNGMEGNEQLNAMTKDLINTLVSAKMEQLKEHSEPVGEIPVSSTDETDILSPESLYSTDSGDELNISPITSESDSETCVFKSTNTTFEYPNNAHC